MLSKDGSIFYLLPNRSYTVGRKECDLVVKDQAVSRKHAVITVNVNDVSVTDCGSTYGTFVADVKLKVNEATQIPNDSVIKFGVMTAVFKMTHVSITTTTSGIGSELKATLKKNIYAIGGSLVNSWTEKCTHLTVEEILLTVKVLSSVISGTPIVTLQYWDEYLDAIKNNKPIPNISYYTPKCSEVLLNGNLSFEYNEERKRLFKDKIFLFALKSDKAKMDSLVKLAGGDSISWEENPLPEEKIEEEILKNYVIIQTSDSGNVDKIAPSLLTFIKKYTETGKRTIQLQELALAIVGCSCEKECNPNFNRQAAVFKISPSQSQKLKNEKILAMPTQSLELDCSAEPKTELIIPETCEITTKIEVSPVKTEDVIDPKPLEVLSTPWTSKRISDTDHNVNSAKKPKFEDVLSPASSNSSSATFIKSVDSTSEIQSEAAPGKSLFAFKYEKITTTPTNYINPFATKRKAQEDVLNQTKKPTFLNSTLTSSQTTNNSKVVVNPFSNILRSKRRKITDDDDVKFTSTQVHDNTTMGVNSLEINFSAISAVDPVLEKSFRWISKGDTTNVSSLNLNEKQNEMMDKDLLIFINSFRNCVVVEEDEDLIVRRPSLNNTTIQSLNDSNVRNFKTFRKVQPLRIQTTIIPESSYVSIVCNQRSE